MPYALKVVGTCPADLLDARCKNKFNPSLGVVLAKFEEDGVNPTETWNKRHLSEAERDKLRDVLYFLHSRNALVSYNLPQTNTQNSTLFPRIVEELNVNDPIIEFLICSNQPPEAHEQTNNRIFTIEDAENNLKFKNNHMRVSMDAKSMCEKMTPYVFNGENFKIIDPYIFEMGKNQAQSRVDFIIELCRRLDAYNTYNNDKVLIEVIGKSYFKNHETKRKEHHKKINLMKQLRDTVGLREAAEKYRIQFVGLDDSHADDDIHLRCLYTNRYIIGVDNSFQTRRDKTQKIWYGTEYSATEIRHFYHEDSDMFPMMFEFYASEIWNK